MINFVFDHTLNNLLCDRVVDLSILKKVPLSWVRLVYLSLTRSYICLNHVIISLISHIFLTASGPGEREASRGAPSLRRAHPQEEGRGTRRPRGPLRSARCHGRSNAQPGGDASAAVHLAAQSQCDALGDVATSGEFLWEFLWEWKL